MDKPTYFYCGCCDQYHSTEFFGDCRDDSQRFNVEDLDATHGYLGWEEVELDS